MLLVLAGVVMIVSLNSDHNELERLSNPLESNDLKRERTFLPNVLRQYYSNVLKRSVKCCLNYLIIYLPN